MSLFCFRLLDRSSRPDVFLGKDVLITRHGEHPAIITIIIITIMIIITIIII